MPITFNTETYVDPVDQIRENLKEEYLRDYREWMVMVSFGKDSAFLLTLVLEMLLSLDEKERHKRVHVISSDTLVETYLMSNFVHDSMKKVNELAERENLPVTGTVVKPDMKHRFFYQVLGRGNPPPTAKSRFRWCTHKLKQIPTQEAISSVIKQTPISLESFGDDYDCLMLLGTREEESVNRAASMKRHAIDQSRYHRHSDHQNILVYQPLAHLTSDELWFYLMDIVEFPWGTAVEEMNIQYGSSFMECGIKAEGQGGACGGNSRSGCWTCVIVNEDKMLNQLVDEGHWQMKYLNDWKKTLLDIRNDVRYREPYRKMNMKKKEKERHEETTQTLFQTDLNQRDLQNNQRTLALDVASDDLLYQPGSFTVEARKKLLEWLLWIQDYIQEPLIDDDEVEAVLQAWRDEGYEYAADHVSPTLFHYDGLLAMEKENGFKLNEKESTSKTPVFHYQMDVLLSYQEAIDYIEQKKKESDRAFHYIVLSDDSLDELPYNTIIFLFADPAVQTREEGKKILNDWLSSYENEACLN